MAAGMRGWWSSFSSNPRGARAALAGIVELKLGQVGSHVQICGEGEEARATVHGWYRQVEEGERGKGRGLGFRQERWQPDIY